MMVQQSGLINGKLDHFFNLWGEPKLFSDDVGFIADNEFNSAANLVQFHAKVAQYPGSNTFTFACEGEHEVFGAKIVVLKTLRFFLGAPENPAELHCERVKPLVTHFHHALDEVCLRES